jgi:hypothetical protein
MADVTLPAGFQLEDDEVVVHTGKDWSVAVNPLVLTSRRLITRIDPSGGPVVAIRLSEVRDVRLRKPLLGFTTVIVEWGEQQRASFPAHINAQRIKADIQAAVKAAQRPKLSVVPSEPGPPDRIERLRRLGELKASGVLSETEFEAEKGRILKEP